MKFKLMSAKAGKRDIEKYEHRQKLIDDGLYLDEHGYIVDSEIEVSSLEDLIALSKRYEEALILDPSSMTITIYNDYVE